MRSANNEPLSPLLFLHRALKLYPERIAVVDGNKKLSYNELAQQCLQLASALQSLNVKAGDRVAYLCDNGLPLLVAHYGVALGGALIVPINKRLSTHSICQLLLHSEAAVLVCDAALYNQAFNTHTRHVITIGNEKINTTINYYHLIERQATDHRLWELWPENEHYPISLNYTSGTSGHPKGVLCSHRSVYLNALGECLHSRLNRNSAYLWILPMFHCNGWCFTWAVTAVGAKHVFVDTANAETILTTLLQEKITHFCAAPTVLIKLRESRNFAKLAALNTLTILTAGSAPPTQLIADYDSLGIELMHVYGMTETHGPHLVCEEKESWNTKSLDDRASLLAAQGIPSIHGGFARVIDKTGKDVRPDGKTMGEVILRGNNVMLGYFKDNQSTEHVLQKGWLHTGDAAVVRSDGYIEIKDRLKDIIISGGENIASIDIENILYQIPEVLYATVIAEPDDYWGEIPHAFLELKSRITLTEKAVMDFCRESLPSYMCPKKITFQELPKTSTGKIKKYLLKKQLRDIKQE